MCNEIYTYEWCLTSLVNKICKLKRDSIFTLLECPRFKRTSMPIITKVEDVHGYLSTSCVEDSLTVCIKIIKQVKTFWSKNSTFRNVSQGNIRDMYKDMHARMLISTLLMIVKNLKPSKYPSVNYWPTITNNTPYYWS